MVMVMNSGDTIRDWMLSRAKILRASGELWEVRPERNSWCWEPAGRRGVPGWNFRALGLGVECVWMKRERRELMMAGRRGWRGVVVCRGRRVVSVRRGREWQIRAWSRRDSGRAILSYVNVYFVSVVELLFRARVVEVQEVGGG